MQTKLNREKKEHYEVWNTYHEIIPECEGWKTSGLTSISKGNFILGKDKSSPLLRMGKLQSDSEATGLNWMNHWDFFHGPLI